MLIPSIALISGNLEEETIGGDSVMIDRCLWNWDSFRFQIKKKKKKKENLDLRLFFFNGCGNLRTRGSCECTREGSYGRNREVGKWSKSTRATFKALHG